jgi:hypothetical protein
MSTLARTYSAAGTLAATETIVTSATQGKPKAAITSVTAESNATALSTA